MIILTLLMIMLTSLVANAAVYSVNTRAELLSAITSTTGCDTVIIEPGTYTNWGAVTIPATEDGNATCRKTLTVSTPGSAVFQGQGALTLDVRAAYWTVSNIKWQQQTGFGSYSNSTGAAGGSLITLDGAQGVIVEGNEFLDPNGAGCPMVVMQLNGTRVTRDNIIRNNQVDNYSQPVGLSAFVCMYGKDTRGFNVGLDILDNTFNTRSVTSTNPVNHWIKIGDGSLAYDADVRIEGNSFSNDTLAVPGQEAIWIHANDVEVVDNTLNDSGGVQVRGGSRALIARNAVIDPDSQFTDYAFLLFGTDHAFLNNLCYTHTNSKTCLQMGMGNTDVNGDGSKDYLEFNNSLVAYNTIDGFVDESVILNKTTLGNLDGVTTVHPHDITFRNNAIRQQTGTMVLGTTCASRFTAITHNAYSGSADSGCLSIATSSVTADPRFFNSTAGDYTLLNSSPLIGAAFDLSAVELQAQIDKQGGYRDTDPDIGAYEFGAEANVIVPPPGGTCDDIYQTSTAYELCEQEDMTCSFNVQLNQATCDDHCTTYGQECVGSLPNGVTDKCEPIGSDEGCSVPRNDQICICTINNDPPTPPSSVVRYVDSACGTQGDGTSTTCGANGPWTSLKYALETADCQGMTAGDTLVIQGSGTSPADGNWYGATHYNEGDIVPDDACSGIFIQNESGEHVVLDGTVDISGSTWTAIGSGVYEATAGVTGTDPGTFPFTAWYDLGAGEGRLNLIQSSQTCTSSLASGTMSYNPLSRRVCAHLPGNVSPATATYFRIPFYGNGINMGGQNTDNVTYRENPNGTGSLTFTRFRDDGLVMNPSVNQGIVVDGITLSWVSDTCLESTGSALAANYKWVNNAVEYCGQRGISWVGDIGQSVIGDNTVRFIGENPVFQTCNGVGSGCLAAYNKDPVGILINNCVAAGATRRGTIMGNEVHNVGYGRAGYSRGIGLENCTYNNLIDANLIHTSAASPTGNFGIQLTGIPSGQYHDQNIISNNRIEATDYGITVDYNTATSQSGKVNYIVGNTVHNPNTEGYTQLDGAGVGGTLNVKNNIGSIDDGYVKLFNIPVSSMWVFTNNALDCDNAACDGQDVATVQGANYERVADCTTSVDCFRDLGNGNIDGPLYVQPGTLTIIEGSIAVDTGTNMDQLTTDYAGVARPIGAFADIGAHEFQSVSVAANLEQHAFRFYGRWQLDGDDPLADENVIPRLYNKSQINLRFSVFGEGFQSAQYIADLTPFYQLCNPTCGSWVAITTSCTGRAVCLIANPNRQDNDAITNDLALDGRSFSAQSRFVDESPFVQVAFLSDNQVELEYSLGMVSTVVDPADVVKVRLQYADGESLSLYTETPSITVGTGYGRMDTN